MVASELRSLKVLVFAAATFSFVCMFLNGAILATGLRGNLSQNVAETTLVIKEVVQAPTVPAGGQPVPTEGNCLVGVRAQEEGEVIDTVPGWHPDNNIIVTMPGDDCDVAVSPTWTIAEWDYTIVRIAPGAVFSPPEMADNERQLVKVIKGTVLDVNADGLLKDGHWETHVVTVPNRAMPLYIDNSVDEITAGAEGAVIFYMKVTEEALATPFTDMEAAPATVIAGPFSELLTWVRYDTYYEENFKGLEFWNLAAINIQNNDGSRLHNVQWWTAREDDNLDGGYHNHADSTAENTFGEIHMLTHVPNPITGMQTSLPSSKNLNFIQNPDPVPAPMTEHQWNNNNQTVVQISIPQPPGFVHGPLWSVDPNTGEPTRFCNGAIQYPYHRMLLKSNGKANNPLRYVSWIAFEHPPEDVTVPLEMITEWPNAFLQSTMAPDDCAAASSDADGSD